MWAIVSAGALCLIPVARLPQAPAAARSTPFGWAGLMRKLNLPEA